MKNTKEKRLSRLLAIASLQFMKYSVRSTNSKSQFDSQSKISFMILTKEANSSKKSEKLKAGFQKRWNTCTSNKQKASSIQVLKSRNNNFLNRKTKTCWNFFQDRAFTNGAKILKHWFSHFKLQSYFILRYCIVF